MTETQKISIDIPFNNYKTPQAIRPEVVQMIVDAFIKRMDTIITEDADAPFTTYNFEWRLDSCENCISVKKVGNKTTLHTGRQSLYSEKDGFIRVRGVEIDAAFTAMSGAGYYLYSTFNITTQTYQFWWWTKPSLYNLKPIENPRFTLFID